MEKAGDLLLFVGTKVFTNRIAALDLEQALSLIEGGGPRGPSAGFSPIGNLYRFGISRA